jgi:Nucleoside-diphosphate-sugar epimerases
VNIAVTGASGYIGRHVVHRLNARGHQVRPVARPPAVASGVGAFPGEAFADCEAVIHLAGRAHVQPRRGVDNAVDALAHAEGNVVTLDRAIVAAAASGVRRFVLVSSIGVNGRSTNGVPFDEATAPNPREEYARSKLSAEAALLARCAEFGIESVIVRPTIVYGPRAPGNFGLLLRAVSSGLPLPFGSLRAQRNLMSVWSLAEILERCATVPGAAGQLFLAADADRVDLPTIVEALARGMGLPSRVIRVPVGVLRMLARMAGRGDAFEKLSCELLVNASRSVEYLGVETRGTTMEHIARAGQLHQETRA